jgi:hypothetical protein
VGCVYDSLFKTPGSIGRLSEEGLLLQLQQLFPMVQKLIKALRHASVSIISSSQPALLVTATSGYIPIEQFKETFSVAGVQVAELGIQKVIFDKRMLTVFHQPSMVWYFVEWKEKMYDLGLKRHVKILPPDEVFRESVKIGRSRINEDFPHGKFHEMEILYAASLEEALAL